MKKLYLALIISGIFNFNHSFKAQSEIWGLTTGGGDGYGTIYGLPTGNTTVSTQFNLTGNPGSNPQYTKLLENTATGKLYGMTNTGGANGVGVIFEYDTVTSTYIRKVDFGGTNGANPRGALIKAANGKLYGMTQLGGASSLGVIFEYDIATNTYTKKIDFTGTTGAAPGAQPYGTLLDPSPGSNKLYGLTRFGGANNLGVLFEYDYSTNVYTVKVDFNGNVGTALGGQPFGQLVKAGTNTLYGLANNGGTNNVGSLFEYDYVNNVFTKKVDLSTPTGSGPQGSLMLATNGKLYGMTTLGGASSSGTIFEYNIGTNTYTTLINLVNGVNAMGGSPFGELMEATNGKLYGMTRLGGGNPAVGTIFELDLTGPTYTKKIDLVAATGSAPFGSLIQVSTGKIYGLTSQGGAVNAGVLFQYNISTNAYVNKVDLNLSNGGAPNGHLMQASNGKLYGLTSTGGASNIGVLFEYDKTTTTYTKKVDLTGATGTAPGSAPFGSLVQSSVTGKLYGLTSAGGASALGTLFDYDISTNTYTKRVDFNGNAGTALGSVPYGSLVQYSGNNKLYGMAKQGGSSNQGTIFEFDPATNTMTKKYDMSLASANGYSAIGSMVESSGKLYGMTSLGGTNSSGVIFEYDPGTNTYTKKIDFTGTAGAAEGSLPYGSLVQSATVGILYGMTKTGGANDQGVIFEYNVSTNTYTKKHDFNTGTGGAQPLGSLTWAANGNLYGVTNIGGTNGSGVLFEYNVSTNTYTKKMDFTGTNGTFPAYTQLLEICTKPSVPGSISATSNAICETNSVTQNFSITAVPNATSYAWTLPLGSSVISGSATTNLSANLGAVAANVYTYGVAGVNICGTGTLSINSITINPRPTISVNNATICSGNSAVISPSGAATYSIQGGSFVVSPSGNTTYTVAGTSAFGCISSNTPVATVVVNALPTISVTSGVICSGDSYTIIPSGASTYTYSGGTNIVSPTTTTAYSVTGTDINGCVSSNTAISSVTVNSLPVIGINNGTICAGQNHTFVLSGANTYTIQGGSLVVSPSGNTSYTVIGTSTAGCVSAAPSTGSVLVNSLPVISANNGTICSGQSFTIIANGAGAGGTYTYGTPGGVSVVSPTTSTSYTVSGTTAEGCVSSFPATSNVLVNPLPTITVTNGTVCAGTSFTIVPGGAGAGGTYSFGTPGGTNVVTPSTTTSYPITGTTSAGCASAFPATVTVLVNALPTVSVNSGSICSGSSFTIVPTGAGSAATYTVYPVNVTLVSPTVNTTYSIVGTNSLGCVSSNTALSNVTVIALPAISASNGTICLGDVFTTTVSGASTYTYVSSASTINASGSITLSPSATTSYSVSGTSSVGCISANPAIMTVMVNPLPPVAISGPTAICDGETTTLTASGAISYNWGASSNTFLVITPTGPTTYTVLGTDGNNCSNMASFSIGINPLPTITVISGAICPGNSFTLTPGGASTYTYSSGSNIVAPSVTTSYSVTGTSSLGCVSANAAVATVSVVNILTVTISGNTSVCLGGTVNLTANGASTYTWSIGLPTNTIALTPTASANYSVVGASGTCLDTAFVAVTVNPLPVVTASSSSSAICIGESATLTADGASSYLWTTQEITQAIIVSPSISTTYSVIGTNSNNCSSTAVYLLNVDACLGINQASANLQYALYPNPNAGEFVIETSQPLNIIIIDALGRVVLKQQLTEGKNLVDLNEKAKGIYFVQVKQGNQTKTMKIVKQ